MFLQQVGFYTETLTPEEIQKSSNLSKYLYDIITDTAGMGDELDSHWALHTRRFTETFQYSAELSGSQLIKAQLTEILVLYDHIYPLVEESLTDTLTYEATQSQQYNRIAQIVETLALDGAFDDTLNATNIIAATMVLWDVISYAKKMELTETLLLGADMTAKWEGYVQLVDTLLFDDVIFQSGLIVVLTDTMAMSASISSSAILKSIITDTIEFYGSVHFDGEEYLALSYNTQSGGISEFTNYAFNSFSYPYAANSDGIYKLDDSIDDNGVAIDASIRTGLMDFGTSLKKQVPVAYIGLTEEGRCLLRVISTDHGIKKERWYEVNARNNALDNTRIKMGKGVKGRYWQFELSNIEGEDFGIESLEMLPFILKRRKQ